MCPWQRWRKAYGSTSGFWKIAEKFGFDSNQTAPLFALWLNTKRLPRFIYLEDYSLNKQVVTMIEHSKNLKDLHDLHNYIYRDAGINMGLYNYFWIKMKHEDLEIYQDALNILFSFEYDLIEIVKQFPHIHPNDIILHFRNFAIKNKDTHREHIAKSLVSRSELNNAIAEDNTRFPDSMISENPELINLAITCELYNQGFFKI